MTFQHHSSGKPSLNRFVGFCVDTSFLLEMLARSMPGVDSCGSAAAGPR